jgi:hypothetical protein
VARAYQSRRPVGEALERRNRAEARLTRIGVGPTDFVLGRALSIDQHCLGVMACGLRKSLEGTPVNVLILDEQLKLADQIRQLARLHGWQLQERPL